MMSFSIFSYRLVLPHAKKWQSESDTKTSTLPDIIVITRAHMGYEHSQPSENETSQLGKFVGTTGKSISRCHDLFSAFKPAADKVSKNNLIVSISLSGLAFPLVSVHYELCLYPHNRFGILLLRFFSIPPITSCILFLRL